MQVWWQMVLMSLDRQAPQLALLALPWPLMTTPVWSLVPNQGRRNGYWNICYV